MKIHNLSFLLFMGIFLCFSEYTYAMYKCTDNNGKITYSDRPCPNTTKAEELNIEDKSAKKDITRNPQDAQALLDLINISQEFAESHSLAISTGKSALSGPVSNLQMLMGKARNISVPGHLSRAKDLLIKGMDYCIDGLIQFMRDDDKKSESLTSSCELRFSMFMNEVNKELTHYK